MKEVIFQVLKHRVILEEDLNTMWVETWDSKQRQWVKFKQGDKAINLTMYMAESIRTLRTQLKQNSIVPRNIYKERYEEISKIVGHDGYDSENGPWK